MSAPQLLSVFFFCIAIPILALFGVACFVQSWRATTTAGAWKWLLLSLGTFSAVVTAIFAWLSVV